ncbi:MurR/RpiR family transcriptional regulator [Paenibacillus sacheonensis]|uniref:SIS domain-containing protein n=1 Tax=Paenibacillus sacheonensis TaxID=742054 RepID=A0A7X5BZR1_9BACL|nr:MurR/RpiR family transcriptional regulator [Paenibacillus sacheonensis]MBM7567088.1 DNA-binding MurR/RpiR family transcriptional regulator [Paenibacillus sacheonensis]NBC70982.1 SIS domain-containing protein [Paenibacillus sacheonensis]
MHAESLWDGRTLTKGHQRIADYISKHMDDIVFMVEEDLAQACQVSISTVSRFWAVVGAKNLKEFKQRVKDEVLLSPSRKLQSAFEKVTDGTAAASHVMASADYLRQTAERLEQAGFEAAAGLLGTAGTVHIYGPGSAEGLAALMDFRLTRFGVPCRRLTRGGHELFDQLIHVRGEDAIVIFGFVSESPEMAVLLEFAKERGCRSLLITDLAVSGMLGQADVCLYTARGELWEFHSMVAPVAVIEALFAAVGKQREAQALHNGEELHRLRRQYRSVLPKNV